MGRRMERILQNPFASEAILPAHKTRLYAESIARKSFNSKSRYLIEVARVAQL